MQGANYLVPLIVFPYLTRKLGIANYGLYALIHSVILYFNLVVGYGFRLTATDKIAKSVDEEDKKRIIFWTTIGTKLVLMIACFLILILSGIFIEEVATHILLFLIGFMIIFGNILIPDFYFLGTQKMQYITIATTIGKVIYAILIFLLVKSKGDVLPALLSNGIGTLIIGIIAFAWALKSLNFKVYIPDIKEIIAELKDGFYVFLSQISVSFYTTINTIILGAFTTTTLVGYYSIAEKIYRSLGSFIATPFNMAIYPRLSKLYVDNKERYKIRVRQFMFVLLAAFAVMGVLLFFCAEPIVHFLIKDPKEGEIATMITLVKIVSLALFFNPFGAFFSQQFIITNRKKRMLQIIIALGIINIALVMIFIPNIYLLIWAIVINRFLSMVLNGYFALKEI